MALLVGLALGACSSADAPADPAPPRSEAVPPAAAPASEAPPGAPLSPSSPAAPTSGPRHLRYLAINVGNVAFECRSYEFKLCTPEVGDRVRNYIGTWQPDVVLLSEVLDEPQLDRVLRDSDITSTGSTTSNLGGPLLPPELGYAHVCHSSIDRDTGEVHDQHPLDDKNASHRHECVAWRKDRFTLSSAAHVFGANSPALRSKCNYDFTAQAATLRVNDSDDGSGKPIELTGVAPHPASDSEDPACRKDMIGRMWKELASKPRVFVGGDFNTGDAAELQVPPAFHVNYSHGLHFGTQHTGEYTAWYYVRGGFAFDHAFASFGRACTDCGKHHGGSEQDLALGSVVGDWDGHPHAAKPGLDHRQILVDLTFDQGQ